MRYYKTDLTNKQTGEPVLAKSLGGMGLTSLLPNGQPNMAALNVEWDIPASLHHTPAGRAFVRVWGLGLAAISSAANLVGPDNEPRTEIAVYGGMSRGLPLATASQAGLLVKGEVLQAWGNWAGTDQTVDMVIAPSTGTFEKPLNLVLNWQANTPLADALRTSLKTALPDAKLDIRISPRLVLNYSEFGYYHTLGEFASTVIGISKAIIKDDGYPRVAIAYDGDTVIVADSTIPPKPIALRPEDLIGQPTWIKQRTISIKTAMRGDLDLSSVITLPPTLVSTQSGAAPYAGTPRNQTSFSGDFVIEDLRHYANFRQPSSDAWATVIQAYNPRP